MWELELEFDWLERRRVSVGGYSAIGRVRFRWGRGSSGGVGVGWLRDAARIGAE
jgi:hypothetical protein